MFVQITAGNEHASDNIGSQVTVNICPVLVYEYAQTILRTMIFLGASKPVGRLNSARTKR